MPEVRMTVEEYLALVANASSMEGVETLERARTRSKIRVSRKKRPGKAAPGLSKAMKEANRRLRTKSGKLRKGKTQADVARLAHRIRRQKYA